MLALYVALVGAMLGWHEPWFDEAHAWLLARDAGIWQLFAHELRYEGAPGLWHAILLIPAKTGLPYLTLNVISALLGAVATYLLLRHSPFPPLLKALLPFTYFLLYQYAVVSRSYALLAPILFLLAIVWPRRREKLLTYTLLLVLLANVSAHGILIAGSLMGIELVDVLRHRRELGRRAVKRQLAAAGVFAVVSALLVVQLRPPSDLSNDIAPDLSAGVIATIGRIINQSTTGVEPLSLLVLGPIVLWFWRVRYLTLFLVPTAIVVVFLAVVYHLPWHDGVLFIFFLFALWVSLADPVARARAGWGVRKAMLAAVLIVTGFQVVWSFESYRYDLMEAYSGTEALAAHIQEHGDGKTIFTTSYVPDYITDVAPNWGAFPSFAVQPYFDRNVFANYHEGRKPSFWRWSSPNGLVFEPRRIRAARPDWIILNIKFDGARSQLRRYPGYRVRARFPGALALKTGTFERDGYILLERSS